MEYDLTNILKTFFDKLHNSIIREETKLRNESVLWTLMEINAKRTEKYLSNSSYSTAQFSREQLNELLKRKLIQPFHSISNKEEFVLTAKGIWKVEKEFKNFTEDNLLEFIQAKHLIFSVKQKPMDDKDKLAIFCLLCVRNFSANIPMDLTSSKYRDGWTKIFQMVFKFLSEYNFLKAKPDTFDNLISTKGSEHPVQSIMRHRNDLPIKSGQVFCNPGNSKYYLDLIKDDKLNFERLKYAFKLVFQKIPDLSTAILIGDFCIETANNMAKYVMNDYQLIDSTYDEIIKRVIKNIYVG